MKYDKKEVLNLVGGSALAVVLYETLISYIPSPIYRYAMTTQDFGRIGKWAVTIGFVALILLLASIPVIFFLKAQKMDRAMSIGIVGAIIAAPAWVILGVLALGYVPLDRTSSLYITILGSYFVTMFLAKRLTKPSK